MGKNIGKDVSGKYSQKLLDSAKKSTADTVKVASKRAIQKTAGATGDLIGNTIAEKTTNLSKKSSMKLSSKELYSKTDENEIEITKERYISPEERQQIIDGLRLT